MKVVALILLLACTAHASPLARKDFKPLAEELGPVVQAALNDFLKSLTNQPPVELLPGFPRIKLDIATILEGLIGDGKASPVTGRLVLESGPLFTIQAGAECDKASVILNSIVQPLNIDVGVRFPGVGLSLKYSFEDVMVANVLPIRGQGNLFLGIGFFAGVDADLKFKLGTNPGTFTAFDFSLGFLALSVKLDGLEAGEAFSELVSEIINNVIEDTGLIDLINNALNTPLIHEVLQSTLHDFANEAVTELTYADIVDLLKPKPPAALSHQ